MCKIYFTTAMLQYILEDMPKVFGVVKQKFYPKEMSNSEENVKALRKPNPDEEKIYVRAESGAQAKEFGIKARTACENTVSSDDAAMTNVVEFLKAVERSL
ncbi:unnamed protein product [Porites lobata]|uniref:Uncharacterized protein n=1 Tax=Porites lobata TaxID=104759 RepID=A0ABN8MZR9_9CNID|nr:unnamed protein product [Porites lobata]